jgi:hypothetical protein
MALTDKVRIVSVPDGCGGTLTKASITGLTPAALAAYNKIEHDKARVIAEAAEARAIGVVPRTLNDLLFSRISEIDKNALNKRSVAGQSLILPFSYRNRRANLGYEYFNIASGEAHASAGSTVNGIVYPTSAWEVVVNVGPSSRASALTNLHRFFLPGEYMYVENVDSAGVAGVDRDKRVTAFKIITASTVGGVTKVTIAANRTAAWWAAATNEEKAIFQPVFGVAHVGTNSVGDYESWCANQPSDFSKSLLIDWHQTSRYTQCYNDVYEEVLNKILSGNVNEVEKNYMWLSLKEQNAMQRQVFEDKLAKDIFFGDIIDEKQLNPELYASLPPIQDPEDGTVYGYKARALGLRTLLANEQRVIDMHGGPLDLDLLWSLSYEVYRNRRVSGDSVDCIDWMTDKDTAHLLNIAFLDFLRKNYGYNTTQFLEMGKVMDGAKVAYRYNRYTFPGLGFDIAIFVEEFFTDRVLAFGDGSNVGGAQGNSTDFKASGRSIWLIDWSDFNLGIVATNSAKREYKGKITAEANSLFSCVIAMNTKHYDLRSTTWTSQLGDAARHLVVENYSLGIPTFTLNPASPNYS